MDQGWQRIWRGTLAALGLLTATPGVAAGPHVDTARPATGVVAVPPAMRSCFVAAGRHYHIAPTLLEAIARTESHLDPRAFHRNRNGTVDVGLMQINSGWFASLRQEGVLPKALWDPCMSIWVGARILARNIDQFGYNWKSVGAYNAGSAAATRPQRARYVARVAAHLLREQPRPLEVAEYPVARPARSAVDESANPTLRERQ